MYGLRLYSKENVEIGEEACKVAVHTIGLGHALIFDPEIAVGFVIFLFFDLFAAFRRRIFAGTQNSDFFLVGFTLGFESHCFQLKFFEGAHDFLLSFFDIIAN